MKIIRQEIWERVTVIASPADADAVDERFPSSEGWACTSIVPTKYGRNATNRTPSTYWRWIFERRRHLKRSIEKEAQHVEKGS